MTSRILVAIFLALSVGGCATSLASASSVHSDDLGKDMAIETYSSPGVATCPKAPILILFHGRGGDAGQWMSGNLLSPGVGVDAIADRLAATVEIVPLTVVSASIDDSYGVDSAAASDDYSHGAYGVYIQNELIPWVLAHHNETGKRPLYIGGLSMGGYAALNVALDSPGRFAGVGALSPAFWVSPPTDRAWMYSADGQTSLFERASAGAADGLRVFIGTGTNDYPWIRQAATTFDRLLGERGVSLTTQTVDGGHDVNTWHALAEPMLRALFGDRTSGGCP